MGRGWTRRELLRRVGELSLAIGGTTVVARMLAGCTGGSATGACYYLGGDSITDYYTGANYAYFYACPRPVASLDCYNLYANFGFYAYSGEYEHFRFGCTEYVRAE